MSQFLLFKESPGGVFGVEAPKPNVPLWRDRLMAATKEEDIPWNDLRDRLIYLRSMRNLLEARKEGELWLTKLSLKVMRAFRFRSFCSLLDAQHIISSLEASRLGPEVPYNERRELIGVRSSDRLDSGLERCAKDYLSQGARAAKHRSWQYRLEVALTESIEKGWYPLFGTYTVDPELIPKSFNKDRDRLWRETDAWNKFVKRWQRTVAEACGLGRKPSRWPKVSTFFQYMAVLEHGAAPEQTHPHIHVIWMCKDIPAKWKEDPNKGRRIRTVLDIAGTRSLWPWGAQQTTMGIFCTGSYFKREWKKPYEYDKAGELVPRKCSSATAVAIYIGKYLAKGDRKWDHRVKATKSLGLSKLRLELKKVWSIATLQSLSMRPEKFSVSVTMQNLTSCPLDLLRQCSKKELLRRLHTMKQPRGRKLLWMMMTESKSEFFMNYLASVKRGLKPWRETRERRYSQYSQMLVAPPCTVHCEERMRGVLKFLNGFRKTKWCEPVTQLDWA